MDYFLVVDTDSGLEVGPFLGSSLAESYIEKVTNYRTAIGGAPFQYKIIPKLVITSETVFTHHASLNLKTGKLFVHQIVPIPPLSKIDLSDEGKHFARTLLRAMIRYSPGGWLPNTIRAYGTSEREALENLYTIRQAVEAELKDFPGKSIHEVFQKAENPELFI